MKKPLIIAIGLAVVGGAAWAFAATGAGWGVGHPPSTWAEPANYSYRVWYAIEGPGAGTYDITVRDHKVTLVEPLPDSRRPGAESWITVENAWTLADLVDKYFEAKDGPKSDATITYDSQTGAPVTISLDWIVDAIDDEEHFSILAFNPGFIVSAT